MALRIRTIDLHVLNMHTRMPFKYGIATLTAVPHLFLRLSLEADARSSVGIAADGLPPKWFTKDPDTSFRDDLVEMFDVIRSASEIALHIGQGATVFELWRQIYERQREIATPRGHPPLLWAFGVSLVERAMIDAFCRARATTFAKALRDNALGVELGAIHGELAGKLPNELLPAAPSRSIRLRHTIGLADPLTESDIPDDERVHDGLPQSLEACVQAYGLTHFKIKLCGDRERDMERLRRLAPIFGAGAAHGKTTAFTLDGNEQYRAVAPFRAMWEAIHAEATIAALMPYLRFVEQPFHRDVALTQSLGDALRGWHDRPGIIIDESDGDLDSLPRALDCGYAGTSFKSCKGLFKGVANACLIEHRRRTMGSDGVISAEDLATVGPVALLQDLAAAASLGIGHIERNGHHYFAGLSMLPEDVQQQVLDHHGDLYHRHTTPKGDRFPTLTICDGAIALGSINAAPLGAAIELDPSRFTPLHAWRFESLASDERR